VRILVLVTRFPWPNTKGDQQRAFTWIGHLAERHAVTVLATAPPPIGVPRAALEASAEVHVAAPGRLRRAASVVAGVPRAAPGQVAWMMPTPAWREAERLAAGQDVVLAMTARAVRGPLRVPLVVDHVDALSLNMRRRARGPEALPVRLAASAESVLLRRWERRVAAWSVHQIVTAEEDRQALVVPPPITVLPVALDREPFREPPGHRRDIDVIFTGNMRYPPNRTAALRFAHEIVPALRRNHPGLNASVVGRAAGSLGLRGVDVASDVTSVFAYLERAKVAVVPLEGGTGSPYKVLEAAASGAAIVASAWAVARFGMDAATARTSAEFALEVDRLLGDADLRGDAVRRAAPAVEAHARGTLAAAVERILLDAAQQHPAANGQEHA
jgi:hypothetical protein